jgi:glycine/D-amino acid oxidase-like deaminating enzyme
VKKNADAVIIGGGIQGASALYHLTEAGMKNVQLVEMDRVGSGTTRYTASWFVLQSRLEPNIRLSQLSLREFLSFEDKFGVNIDFRQIGSLSINTIENEKAMLELAEYQRSFGVPIDILSPAEIKSIAPFLNVQDIGIGLFCKEDGLVDTFAVLNTYIGQAKKLGATVDEGVRATGVMLQGNKVVGVETTGSIIHTPIVVNAAGIYDKVVAGWVGLDLPTIKAIRHTIFTEPTNLLPENMTLIEILNPQVIYIGKESGAAKYSVGLDETESFAHVPDLPGLLDKYGNSLVYRMPEIAQLGIKKCIAGIRSLPISKVSIGSGSGRSVSQVGRSLPILGPVDGIDGYFNDCAWGGLGVSHAPAGGKLMAELITKKSNLNISIDPFLLRRYSNSEQDPKKWRTGSP